MLPKLLNRSNRILHYIVSRLPNHDDRDENRWFKSTTPTQIPFRAKRLRWKKNSGKPDNRIFSTIWYEIKRVTNGDPCDDELWSNEKVEVRPAIIAEHSRWAASRGGGGAFNAPWINASHRHLPPTAFLRVKHAYPSIPPLSFISHCNYLHPPLSSFHAYLSPYLPAWIYNHHPRPSSFYLRIL